MVEKFRYDVPLCEVYIKSKREDPKTAKKISSLPKAPQNVTNRYVAEESEVLRVSDVSTSVSNTTGSGSASITIEDPNHELYSEERGALKIAPMDIVQIRMTSPTNDNKLFSVFKGVINRTSDSFNNGKYTVSIDVGDLTKYLSMSRTNKNPSLATVRGPLEMLVKEDGTLNTKTDFSTLPREKEPALKGMLIPTLQTNILAGEHSFQQLITMLVTGKTMDSNKTFAKKAALEGLLKWIEVTNYALGNFTLLKKSANFPTEDDIEDFELADKRNWLHFPGEYWKEVMPETVYPIFLKGGLDVWESEYTSALDMCSDIIRMIDGEFFVNRSGILTARPPFYSLPNLPGKESLVELIRDVDIVSWSFEESDQNVVCRYDVHGKIPFVEKNQVNPRWIWAGGVDYDLWRNYGYRNEVVVKSFLYDSEQCEIYCKMLLSKSKGMIHSGSVTVRGDSKWMVGQTITLESRPDIWYYVTGVTHNFSFGGSFFTTLTLMYGRHKTVIIENPATAWGQMKGK